MTKFTTYIRSLRFIFVQSLNHWLSSNVRAFYLYCLAWIFTMLVCWLTGTASNRFQLDGWTSNFPLDQRERLICFPKHCHKWHSNVIIITIRFNLKCVETDTLRGVLNEIGVEENDRKKNGWLHKMLFLAASNERSRISFFEWYVSEFHQNVVLVCSCWSCSGADLLRKPVRSQAFRFSCFVFFFFGFAKNAFLNALQRPTASSYRLIYSLSCIRRTGSSPPERAFYWNS